ncbi:hypothetical protein KKB18_06740 [bacterium]|nr:hypothetical protein [bacterium]
MHVKIVSSIAKLNFDGEWYKDENSESIVHKLTDEAKNNGIPIMVTIENYGTYCISPHGQVLRGSLYDDDKIELSNRRRNKN